MGSRTSDTEPVRNLFRRVPSRSRVRSFRSETEASKVGRRYSSPRPVARFSCSVRNSGDNPMIVMLPIDYLIWKVSHQVEVMAFVAPWKSGRFSRDRLQCLIELSVETLSGVHAAFSVPPQRLRVLTFGGGANNKVNHRGQPCVGRVDELPTKAKHSSDRSRKLRCAVATRQSIRRRVAPSRPARRIPTERESVERVRQREGLAPRRVFLGL